MFVWSKETKGVLDGMQIRLKTATELKDKVEELNDKMEDIEEQRKKLEELRIALEKERSKRPAKKAINEIQALRDQLQEDENARRKVHSALQEMITSVFLYPDTREAHVLVAGIHALRFDGLGNLIDSQVATSAVLEGAHNDNPIGLQRYLDYTKNG